MAREVTGWALRTPGKPLEPWSITRRDLHAIDAFGAASPDDHRQEWPLVPGHEITGRVVGVGAAVTPITAGDAVAVGNIVDSDGTCRMCLGCQAGVGSRRPHHRVHHLARQGVRR